MKHGTDWLSEELDGLRQLRDEVRVQMHLARADARDAWEELEERWRHLEARARAVREGHAEDLAEIREAAGRLARELRDGYRRLKTLL
jgi:predicted anti-sigma-YlaC factor YlaD